MGNAFSAPQLDGDHGFLFNTRRLRQAVRSKRASKTRLPTSSGMPQGPVTSKNSSTTQNHAATSVHEFLDLSSSQGLITQEQIKRPYEDNIHTSVSISDHNDNVTVSSRVEAMPDGCGEVMEVEEELPASDVAIVFNEVDDMLQGMEDDFLTQQYMLNGDDPADEVNTSRMVHDPIKEVATNEMLGELSDHVQEMNSGYVEEVSPSHLQQIRTSGAWIEDSDNHGTSSDGVQEISANRSHHIREDNSHNSEAKANSKDSQSSPVQLQKTKRKIQQLARKGKRKAKKDRRKQTLREVDKYQSVSYFNSSTQQPLAVLTGVPKALSIPEHASDDSEPLQADDHPRSPELSIPEHASDDSEPLQADDHPRPPEYMHVIEEAVDQALLACHQRPKRNKLDSLIGRWRLSSREYWFLVPDFASTSDPPYIEILLPDLAAEHVRERQLHLCIGSATQNEARAKFHAPTRTNREPLSVEIAGRSGSADARIVFYDNHHLTIDIPLTWLLFRPVGRDRGRRVEFSGVKEDVEKLEHEPLVPLQIQAHHDILGRMSADARRGKSGKQNGMRIEKRKQKQRPVSWKKKQMSESARAVINSALGGQVPEETLHVLALSKR